MVLTKLHLGFLKFSKIVILMTFFSFSLTWDPMVVKISKPYSSYKKQPKVFKLIVLNFPPNGPHKTMFGIWEILSFRFLMGFFFENFKFTIVAYGEIKHLSYLENEWLWRKTKWNVGLAGSSSTYMGYLCPCSVQGHFEVIRCTCDFS